MKRVYKSPRTPDLLKKYAKIFPTETWEHFRRRNRRGYREVKQQLLQDQHGLCAYCEISIKLSHDEEKVDDFRVEHFFPKVNTDFNKHNYHLDWQNLLGVCHGGSQPDVADSQWRYSSSKNDRSCDVPKGGKAISERILNPLRIPASVRVFRYHAHNGKMFVDEETCPKNLQTKARNTIRELNLNAPRLRRMRVAVIRTLEDEIEDTLAAGIPLQQALPILAEMILLPDSNGNYQTFFSVARWFLGEAAEEVLKESGYKM